MGVKIDLKTAYFSYYKSYLSFSKMDGDDLHLRSAHGGGESALLRIELWKNGKKAEFTDVTFPEKMTLKAGENSVKAVFFDTESVLFESRNISFRLYPSFTESFKGKNNPCGINGDIVPQGSHMLQYNSYPSRIKLMFRLNGGKFGYHEERGEKGEGISAYFQLEPDESGRGSLLLSEFFSSYEDRGKINDFNHYVQRNKREFDEWLSLMYDCPPEYKAARGLAGYANWASVVKPHITFKRPAMLMSKRIMSNVWSWDHLFNALALANSPKAAQDQYAVMFDFQDEYGAIPDAVNDYSMHFNFCKPPFHGWALQRLMEMCKLDEGFLAEMYPKLCKYTEWWMKYRDCDHDGVPEYNHGNDSGWDNSSVFNYSLPVESPDLCSLLAVQGETLVKIAERLGLSADAAKWEAYRKKMLDTVLKEFWDGGTFFARNAITHERIHSRSLLPFISVVAGPMFPEDVQKKLAAILSDENRFLTAHGMATEEFNSEAYVSDGYWLGPIWAPSTLAIVDGLRSIGMDNLSKKIAKRFCDTVAAGGMAENFDALTGAPLRDKTYTWTSSVFLTMAGKYL